MKRFEDMVAIIVGAADNMGRSAARILAEGGAKVVVTYYSNAAGVADTVRIVEEAGSEVLAVKLDHADEDAVISMVDQVIQRFGKINIVINNAAMIAADFIAKDRDIVNMDADYWDQNLKFNLKGPMLVCKHVIPHMIEAGYGSIVNTGSGVVFRGDSVRNAYSAAKIGLHSLTMDIAASYGKHNIRCNLVSPGLIMTKAVREGCSDDLIEKLGAENLVPFIGEPDDIANVTCFLASREARYVTGQILAVDGGLHVHQCVMGQQ
jgi:NAD(P)-dependent dehydrogenase (short-subunit alcohol dehydrogenase family)